ncbi:MAG: 3-hydroxyacyl-CoA dehydrogenase NAD-binding domain-containing protein [Pseudomonadota bacterium]|nr:3-hydroxyacyl-CoA dehydrogenase NAD-binding domain-containing protein [Pseudomonadota bacterium]
MSGKHWQRERDASGIEWVTLDVAGRGTNVLSGEVIEALAGIVDELAADPPLGVVIRSGKPNGFLAGADVNEFTGLDGRDTALAFVRRGQDLMDRIESLPCPTLALIHGFCVGGGLELALACDYRVALDETGTRLGFPEVRLGIHPGYGGSLRSVRTIGAPAAMDLMLSGRNITSRTALKMGLIDVCVPKRYLRKAAEDMIRTRPRLHDSGFMKRLAGSAALRPVVAAVLRRKVRSRIDPGHYPAPFALIDLWEGAGANTRCWLEQEAESVAELSTTATARNLVRLFLLQEDLKAAADRDAFKPRHVHVVGAGIMGGDIAAWCVLQGLRVTIQDGNPEALGATVKRASALFGRRLKSPRLVTEAFDRLIPDVPGHGASSADVIIEAIFEDLDAKKALFADILTRAREGALIATNTSSIPLEALAADLDDPGRLVGLHFFNPVAKLPLVEIVHGPTTHRDTLDKALAFARGIDKLPLKVSSSPGFLVNRILLPYLLEAAAMVSEGIPAPVVDRAAKVFGMPMGPVELADTVGLDIGLHVAENLSSAYGFEIPQRLRELVDAGKLGRKTGEGFYRYRKGRPVLHGPKRYDADPDELRDRLVLRMVNESLACLREGVVESADALDAGVVFGTGFAPFLGGPIRYLREAGIDRLRGRLESLEQSRGARFAPDAGWDNLPGLIDRATGGATGPQD